MNPFSRVETLANSCLARANKTENSALREHDRRQQSLIKPAGALGKLETIARHLALWQERACPKADQVRLVVFAADHGIVEENVSAYPAGVTAQMVRSFHDGVSAINQLCELLQIQLSVVNLDVGTPSGNCARRNALSDDDLAVAFEKGSQAVLGHEDLICFGEMGIGNTTIASATYHALIGGKGSDWVGPGAGLDADGIERKIHALDLIRSRLSPSPGPKEILTKVGGRDSAAIFAALLEARKNRIPVIVDGFSACAPVALLAAWHRELIDHCLFAHRSAEPAHANVLKWLGVKPLLDLDLRLGEGSGAALAVGLVRAALACFNGMATFQDAGVSEKNMP